MSRAQKVAVTRLLAVSADTGAVLLPGTSRDTQEVSEPHAQLCFLFAAKNVWSLRETSGGALTGQGRFSGERMKKRV